jgi:GNAT superfamily N-acetyltransferase
MSEAIRVERITDASEMPAFPRDTSFFEPYFQHQAKECLAIGGEVLASRTSEGTPSGLFMYDKVEKGGTIYTKSREVFDYFCKSKPFDYLFSEMLIAEKQHQAYGIYSTDFVGLPNHKFSYEVSEGHQVDEIIVFMRQEYPEINRLWISVALQNGERCFMVQLRNGIAGLGWVSLVNGIGRIHSLYVKPQYRRMGISSDIVYAQILWLKLHRARSAFSEVASTSHVSGRFSLRQYGTLCGQVFMYFQEMSKLKAGTIWAQTGNVL